jgi:small subunit ribosomal protein S12
MLGLGSSSYYKSGGSSPFFGIMSTCNQVARKKRVPKRKLNRTPALERCPQKKGFCTKMVLRSPKKPNSGLRRLAKLKLYSNNKRVYAFIPGEKHNLQSFSTVLIRGGRVKDLPGVKYRIIRGKLDLLGVRGRKTARSKYGTKNVRRYL